MAENSNCEYSGCSAESCDGCSKGCASAIPAGQEQPNDLSCVKKVIAVMSGKGGVGKSFVASSIAVDLVGRGYTVGILDADITGPSIPKMFGIKGRAQGCDDGIFPAETENGIRLISVNLLLETEDTPVIWRGPIIADVVKQFWTDVIWGDLDYLIIDMPPGTGDVPLTVFQTIPVDGIVMVTSPQDLVGLIVKKACNMAKAMNVTMLGIVENYSYAICPHCGEKLSVFGESSVDAAAEELGLKVLGKIPVDPDMAQLADAGLFSKVENKHIAGAVDAVLSA